jgi:hypothetical protein
MKAKSYFKIVNVNEPLGKEIFVQLTNTYGKKHMKKLVNRF